MRNNYRLFIPITHETHSMTKPEVWQNGSDSENIKGTEVDPAFTFRQMTEESHPRQLSGDGGTEGRFGPFFHRRLKGDSGASWEKNYF